MLALTNHEIAADIAILDIHLGDTDGISLAKRIKYVLPNCQIIFLTSYVSYAMDVYEVDHVYLILKEKQNERLWPAVELAYKKYCDSTQDTIVFRVSSGVEVRKLSEIQYFERIGRKILVHSEAGDIWIKDSIENISCNYLQKGFFRCHQGYIVNLDFVLSIEEDGYILRNLTLVPVSRSNKKEARDRFFDHRNAIVLHGRMSTEQTIHGI